MNLFDAVRRRLFLYFAVDIDWADSLEGPNFSSIWEKNRMPTVLENGNFEEVGLESVNLPQNANVGVASLVCVCQCAFWSDFDTVQNHLSLKAHPETTDICLSLP